jgi:hypothetical protein
MARLPERTFSVQAGKGMLFRSFFVGDGFYS